MCAIFRICGNESQPGLQLVEKLATALVAIVNFSPLLTMPYANTYSLMGLSGRCQPTHAFPSVPVRQQQQFILRYFRFTYMALPILLKEIVIINWLIKPPLKLHDLKNKSSNMKSHDLKNKCNNWFTTKWINIVKWEKNFDFTSKSLKKLYLVMISSKNLSRSVSCRVQENITSHSFSTSLAWHKEQILKCSGGLGTVYLSFRYEVDDFLGESY